MAAPSIIAASAGATDAGGAWSFLSDTIPGANRIVIFQVLQDGTTNGAVTFTGFADINDLDGTANSMTQIVGGNADGSFPVGSPATGRQFLYIGRGTTAAPTVSGGNSTSEDLYARYYIFSNASTGTILATVIENGTAGTSVNGAATSTTCADTGVTTLGPDRLAINLGALSDDAMGIAVFTGASGGTWTSFTSYETASGTDGTIFYEDCTLATAGTINGGTDTITSIGWGVVGFALIGTTPDTPLPPMRDSLHLMQAVNRSNVY